MSDGIKELVKKLVKKLRVNMHAYDIAQRAADVLEALLEERDSLKEEVERLRGEQRLKSLIGPSENAVERIITERDSLREVVNNLSCNWIDCPDCDRNRELMENLFEERKKKI